MENISDNFEEPSYEGHEAYEENGDIPQTTTSGLPVKLDKSSVPNGTTLIPTQVCGFIDRYRRLTKKSVGAIIKVALTIRDADRSLSDDDLSLFCREIGISPNGSTFRKHMKIAKAATRFIPLIDHLPNNWTTLYKLATLDDERFRYLANCGLITPNMTARDITETRSKWNKDTQGNDNHASIIDLEISFSGLSLNLKVEAYSAIKNLEQEYGFQMIPSQALINDLALQPLLAA